MSRIAKISLIVLVVVFGFLIHIKNNQIIEFNYYIGSLNLPFSLFIVLSLCTGGFLGILVTLPVLIKLKQSKSKLKKQVSITVKEVNNLRVIPMKDSP
jgi:uncharacterized integral membrane protein